jgi:hypothetical protein
LPPPKHAFFSLFSSLAGSVSFFSPCRSVPSVPLSENPAAISSPFCSKYSVRPSFPSPERQQPGLIFLSPPVGFVVLLVVAIAGFLFDLLFVLLAATHVPSFVLSQDSLGR